MNNSKLEGIWNFLNSDVRDLFKIEYNIKFLKREELGKGVFEVKKYDKRVGKEVPYKHPILLQTIPREVLLPKKAWLTYPDEI